MAFAYGVVCYVATLSSFVYAFGFLAGTFGVPESIDSAREVAVELALAINVS